MNIEGRTAIEGDIAVRDVEEYSLTGAVVNAVPVQVGGDVPVGIQAYSII